jgi:transcriptional regulator with XRE-family HTH domain
MIDDAGDAEIDGQLQVLARRLKEEREKAWISQMDLSFLAGLSQNQVYCVETGRRPPNVYTILKLREALRITPASLFAAPAQERQDVREPSSASFPNMSDGAGGGRYGLARGGREKEKWKMDFAARERAGTSVIRATLVCRWERLDAA